MLAVRRHVQHAATLQVVDHRIKNVRIRSQYLDYAALESLEWYDTILHYNVLHHAGVDFDKDLVLNKESLFDYLVRYMVKLREHCNRVVFQMGYNWGGNKQQPVVALHDDAGKIVYNCRFMRQAGWTIKGIAMSYSREGDIPVSHKNLPVDVIVAANARDDETLRSRLGELLDPSINTFSEFYRRPLFVCVR